MPLPPYPVVPQPVSWSPRKQILTGLLRGDLTNAAILLANRPLFAGSQVTTGQSLTGPGTNLVKLDTENVDGWQMHQVPASTIACRFPGFYLIDGYVEGTAIGLTQSIATGVRQVINGTVTDVFGGCGPGNGLADQGYTTAHLVQLDPSTGDECALIASPTTGCTCSQAAVKAEWVGLPSTSSVWPTGTVVTSPQPASPWPFGATTITNVGGIAAGATSMTVSDPTGIVVGGSLGLDYLAGQAVSPLAETVTVTSVAGATIGITATLYPHGGSLSPGAVAVPLSAAFLNQQARDMIDFLCYPPLAMASYTPGSTTIPSQTFPAGTAMPLPTVGPDNFGGMASSTYTFPVSGVYYVFGVAQATGVNFTLNAGLSVNGGTTQWGTAVNNTSASTVELGATVRRHLRVTAGETLQLFASQNNGSPVSLLSARLIVVFRSF